MNKKNLVVNNLVTEYTDYGSGKDMLFLHGWGTSAESFKGLIKEFNGVRCIALSFPGFGKSEMPNTNWGVNEYAEFVRDFIEKLNINPDVIIGHSFGGRVAIKGVSKGYLKPSKLVLIASAGASRKTIKKMMIGFVVKIGKIVTLVPPLIFLRKRLKKLVASKDYVNAGEMKDIFIKVINENLEKDAVNIKVPTLLIWGENDTETPIIEATRLNNCIVGSELKVVPESGHFVFQEKSKDVADEIRRFI